MIGEGAAGGRGEGGRGGGGRDAGKGVPFMSPVGEGAVPSQLQRWMGGGDIVSPVLGEAVVSLYLGVRVGGSLFHVSVLQNTFRQGKILLQIVYEHLG